MFYFGLGNDGKARDLVAVGRDPLHVSTRSMKC